MAEREYNEDTQRLKDSAEKRKLTRRQKKVDEIISKRRKLFANQDEGKVGQSNKAPEDIEVEEDPREKGWLNLSSHRKRRKYSRKKCWICRSSTHYKSRCPFIKCFYCHQYGHMKINCHKRMIEYVFNRVMEDYERKKNKMEQNGIERKKKEEIKECQLKIMKNRAQYSSCKLKKVEGKGEVQWLFWKDKEIGEYIGPGLLGPTLVKFRHNLFKWEQIHMLVERAAPYKVFKIYDGLSHWCPCGANDMDTRTLIGHVKDYHHGIILKNTQLNRPPWLDWIRYNNDELEEEFCFGENFG